MPQMARAISQSASAKSASVAVPSGPAAGSVDVDTYALLNEGIPPEHLVAPYGDPNKMLGQNGKLIDKLPKGTKVGEYVMGDHGLYSPKYRAYQMALLAANKKGIPPHLALGAKDKFAYNAILLSGWVAVALTLYNLYCLAFKQYPWLYTMGHVPEKYRKK